MHDCLNAVSAELSSGVPEALMARSLSLAGLCERALDVEFILYRPWVADSLPDEDLCLLAHHDPCRSSIRISEGADVEKERADWMAHVNATIGVHRGFPLNINSVYNGDSFYPPEIDPRDNSTFRWLGTHGAMKRAVPSTAKALAFRVHFDVGGQGVSALLVMIDGHPLRLQLLGKDQSSVGLFAQSSLHTCHGVGHGARSCFPVPT